jgi:hypothetical protein
LAEDTGFLEEALVKEPAGSVGLEASATHIPSADGFLGYLEGGGPTQPMGFHIMEFLGANHTQVIHTALLTLGRIDLHSTDAIKHTVKEN